MKERKSRRVVHLSRVDQERLAQGEFAFPEAALHQDDAPDLAYKLALVQARRTSVAKSVSKNHGDSTTVELSPRDKEILRELPPHFGKL